MWILCLLLEAFSFLGPCCLSFPFIISVFSRTIMTPFLFHFELGFSHGSKGSNGCCYLFLNCVFFWLMFVLCSEGKIRAKFVKFDWGRLKEKWSLMCPHLCLKTVGQADIPLALAMAMVIPLHKMVLLLSMLMTMIVIAPILHHREYHPFFWIY